jgi:hypothetical protein
MGFSLKHDLQGFQGKTTKKKAFGLDGWSKISTAICMNGVSLLYQILQEKHWM